MMGDDCRPSILALLYNPKKSLKSMFKNLKILELNRLKNQI